MTGITGTYRYLLLYMAHKTGSIICPWRLLHFQIYLIITKTATTTKNIAKCTATSDVESSRHIHTHVRTYARTHVFPSPQHWLQKQHSHSTAINITLKKRAPHCTMLAPEGQKAIRWQRPAQRRKDGANRNRPIHL